MQSTIGFWNFLQSTAGVWGPFVSGLIAAFIVHLLTQSREREKWLLDCKKEEFKQLVSALSRSYVTMMRTFGPPLTYPIAHEASDLQSLEQAEDEALMTMRNRVYIAHELPLEELSNAWLSALVRYKNFRKPDPFHAEYYRINELIIAAALKSVPKSSAQKLKFWRK
jgi:hypothetical protein